MHNFNNLVQFSSVQFRPCHVRLCNPMDCSTPGFLSITNSQSLFKLMSIVLVMPSNHLILCRPLFLPPSVFPSIRVFSNESAKTPQAARLGQRRKERAAWLTAEQGKQCQRHPSKPSPLGCLWLSRFSRVQSLRPHGL